MRGFFFALNMNSKAKHHQSFWQHNPLTRPLLCLILGICANGQLSLSCWFVFSIVLAALGISFTLITFGRHLQFIRIQEICSLSIWITCFLAGIFLSETNKSGNHPFFSGEQILYKEGIFQLAIVSEPASDSCNVYKFNANLISYKNNQNWRPGFGKIRCKIHLQNSTFKPQFGQSIFLSGMPKLPGFQPTQPNIFDYRTWLLQNGFIATIESNHCISLKHQPFSLIGFASNIRNSSLKNFSELANFHVEGELAGALLLGDRKGIDPQITQSFVEVGIIHLLAVSGLHVGLVFQSLMFLLSFGFKGKKFEPFIAFVSILCLWSYALVTGLSASVCRAALMLSLAIIGKLIHRKLPSFNLLASAAFILILIDPTILTDIGFLLSFSAVFGILAVNRYMVQFRSIKNKIARSIVGASIISISAQLATLPLTFYYFGRFPVYFLIANLIAIPIASIISYIGFTALILQNIPLIGKSFIWITLYGIRLLVNFSKFISTLPLTSVYIEPYNAMLLVVLSWIAILILMHQHIGKMAGFQFSLILILGISLFSLTQSDSNRNKHQLFINQKQQQPEFTYVNTNGKLQRFWLGKNGFHFSPGSDQDNIDVPKLSMGSQQANTLLIFANPDYLPEKIQSNYYKVLIVKNIKESKLKMWIEKINPSLIVDLSYKFKLKAFSTPMKLTPSGIPLWNVHKINLMELEF